MFAARRADRRGSLVRLAASLVALPVLAGCATSGVPRGIREPPLQVPSVTEVQRDPDRYVGRRVRWGGTILAVRNRELETEIEILSRPLDSDGEPRGDDSGEGRFIAIVAGFVDPAELPAERLLTVNGPLMRVETRPVGEYPYPYPVVGGEIRHLWPEPSPPPPLWADPWYHPWYRPWHPWYGPWYW